MTEAMCIDLSLLFSPLLSLEGPSILSAGWLFLSMQVIPQIFSLILLCPLAGINSIIFAAINQNVRFAFLKAQALNYAQLLCVGASYPLPSKCLGLVTFTLIFFKTQMLTFIL